MKKIFLLFSLFLFFGISVAIADSYQVKFGIKDDNDVYGQYILNGYLEVFNCRSDREAETQAKSKLSFDSSGKRRINGKSLRLIIEQTMNISEMNEEICGDKTNSVTWVCTYFVIDSDTYELLENTSQIQVDRERTARDAFNRVKSKLSCDSNGKRRVSGRTLKIIPLLLQHD